MALSPSSPCSCRQLCHHSVVDCRAWVSRHRLVLYNLCCRLGMDPSVSPTRTLLLPCPHRMNCSQFQCTSWHKRSCLWNKSDGVICQWSQTLLIRTHIPCEKTFSQSSAQECDIFYISLFLLSWQSTTPFPSRAALPITPLPFSLTGVLRCHLMSFIHLKYFQITKCHL